ncbi:MAG: hypothetical protein PF448_13415 [Bacteroidales bacterium]|jgi:hypothetical protein|nr:hypothetical protein [Bacteroidales bacterium]
MKNQNHYYLLIFFLLISKIFLAQGIETEVQWGELIKDKKKSITAERILGYNENSFFVLKSKYPIFNSIYVWHEPLIVEKYDRGGFQKKQTNKIKPKYQKKELTALDAYFLNGKMMLFSILKDNDKVSLFAESIDENSLDLAGDIKRIDEYTINEEEKTQSIKDFEFMMSPDSSKFLVFANLGFSAEHGYRIYASLYDIELNKLWNVDTYIKLEEVINFSVRNFIVNNNGDVFLSAITKDESISEKYNGDANYTFILFKINELEIKEYVVNNKGVFIEDLQLGYSENKLTCAGFYSHEGPKNYLSTDKYYENKYYSQFVHGFYNSIMGVFTLVLDDNMTISAAEEIYEIDMDIITKGMWDAQIEKTIVRKQNGKNVEMPYFRSKELIPRNDGSFVFIGQKENYGKQPAGINTPDMKTWRTDELITASINNGVVEWFTVMPKYQSTSKFYGNYYSFMSNSGDLYLIFNDAENNIDFDKNVHTVNPFDPYTQKGIIAIGKVDRQGERFKKMFTHYRFEEVYIIPGTLLMTKTGELLMCAKNISKMSKVGNLKIKFD